MIGWVAREESGTQPGSRCHADRPTTPIPPLKNGDRLTRAEFERRYEAMPHIKKAELIEGEVYVAPPVRLKHGERRAGLITWIGTYTAVTLGAGAGAGANCTIRLDRDNEPQPDVLLMIEPGHGGQARIDEDGYVELAPELVADVAIVSVSYYLGKKFHVYRRNGVREYIVCRVEDAAIDWFVLREGAYERLAPGEDGLLRSEVFPGLWLDPAALLRGDFAAVLAVLQRGLATPEHAAFAARLQGA